MQNIEIKKPIPEDIVELLRKLPTEAKKNITVRHALNYGSINNLVTGGSNVQSYHIPFLQDCLEVIRFNAGRTERKARRVLDTITKATQTA